jgi:6-phosphogluconolactonase
VRSIAAGRGSGGNWEVPPLPVRGTRVDMRGAWGAACIRKEGGTRGKHGFPRATEQPPKAVAEEGCDGAQQGAGGGRVVSDVELVIVEDAKEVAAVVAERLAHATREGGHVVLTGGTTPERAYEEAAKRAPDWDKVELWWGDERCVPPDHELSNFGMAKGALLDRLERAPRAVHRIKAELGKDQAAGEYEQELGDTQLDLLLLGVGSDGHVASLFPNAPTLQQRKRVLPAEPGLEPFVDRVTLSLPTLCGAREILFLISGESKAEAARRAFALEPSPETPASLVRAVDGRTTAILDRAAAAMLPA